MKLVELSRLLRHFRRQLEDAVVALEPMEEDIVPLQSRLARWRSEVDDVAYIDLAWLSPVK